ncbi:short-chain collagen C4-like [Liolophura sinensis]|uniref:short-chain collagen C4-like n=1 Tax=Liolophura sinensis TaxID=3198878 RepID=UPI003157F688
MSALITEEVTRYRNNGKKYKAVGGSTRPDSSPRGDSAETSTGGAVYTRWGRKTCPSHSTTLYQGVIAGAHYQHEGEGANHLCLPLSPQWNKTYPGHQSKAYIYGTEFEIYSSNPVFHTSNSGGISPHNRDAQCAVCYTPGRPSHVMIPARLECPSGWTVEYLGFLMAAHTTHKRTEYVCVDQDPDTHPGTSDSVNAHLLYTVEAACSPLPCPNYVAGYEVTCVVCTK